MNRRIIKRLLGCCFAVMLAGCASQEAYRSYTDAVVKANAYRQSPGLTQEFDESGRLVKQSIIMPDSGVPVAQIKDSEWAAPISSALSLGTMGLSGWAITHELSGAIKAVQPNVTTTTTAGGHMAGGNVDIPTTSTTNTTTTTTDTTTATTTATDSHASGGAVP